MTVGSQNIRKGWEGREGGERAVGDKEMGKRRTGMNEVSVYMDACVRVWKERENGGVDY